jgi:hypothetical protein
LGVLHHPPARQQHEAAFGFGKFNHFQLHALFSCCGCRWLSAVASVDKGQCDRLTGDLLPLLSQFAHLSSILLIGWSDQQLTEGIYRHMDVAAFAAFAPS